MLDVLLSITTARLHFWRDKQQREVDFVVPRGRETVDAIECKWNPDSFSARGLAAFRASYPRGRNYVVSPATSTAYKRRVESVETTFVPLSDLRRLLVDGSGA